MIYSYTREIQTDGRYNIGYSGEKSKLGDEIYSEFPNHSIYIKCSGSSVDIDITPDLTASEKITLDTIVSDHKTNINNSPSVFKCTEKMEDPSDININFYGLFVKETINDQGLLVKKEYFKEYDGITYNDLAIEVIRNFIFLTGSDLVSYRDETINWYLEDQSIGKTKLSRKYYDTVKAIKEGIRRRTNLLEKAKEYGFIHISGIHSETGQPDILNSYYFFNNLINDIPLYINGTNKDALIDKISDSNDSFLTQQIKDDLVNILKYW